MEAPPTLYPSVAQVEVNDNIQFRILNGLTQEEKSALDELRREPVAQGVADPYLMVFLFAKKLDVKKAVSCIENSKQMRSKLGISFPVLKHQVKPEIAKSGYNFYLPSKNDGQGRLLSYMQPALFVPKDHAFVDCMTHLFWNYDSSAHEDASVHRAGIVVVEDLADMSLFKNFDQRIKKELGGMSLENVFPGRIQAIYLLNHPFYIRPLLAFAKSFIKNKIVKRVQLVSKSKVPELVDPNQLLVHYGGKLDFNYTGWFDSLPQDY
eukprot:gene4331-5058_t